MANVTLTINGVQVTVPAGTSLLDAATGAGFFIPTLCHDPPARVMVAAVSAWWR